MRQYLKLFFISLGLFSVLSSPVFAEDTQALQAQINELQREMAALKASSAAKPVKKHTAARHHSSAVKKTTTTHTDHISGPNNFPNDGVKYLPMDVDVPGQSFVSTGPYLGVPLSYSGSNLIINSPNINEDVSLLKLRKNINDRLKSLGVPHPEEHSHLLLSGNVEGQALYNSRGGQSNTSDIDVTNVELDAYILAPSNWTSGLIALNYENDIGSTSGSISSNHRTSNSRVFVSKAFITLGDFSKTPVYSTIGQMYVPFGTYSSNMITSPMTKILARTKARAILLGYQPLAPNSFYSSAYIFRGDSHVGSTAKVDNGGINLGYKYEVGKFSGDLGGGVIGNIADSVGMQFTGNQPSFDGFGSSLLCGPDENIPCGNEQLVHRVPAYDVRGTMNFGKWDLLAEYIIASTRFNPNDMTFNSHGAKPQALDVEAAYTFTTFVDKPTTVAVGYGMTKQALAIGLPMTRYSIVVNTSWWRNTLESLEFRHDVNYSAASTATGSNVPAQNGTGEANNVVTAQIDLYF